MSVARPIWRTRTRGKPAPRANCSPKTRPRSCRLPKQPFEARRVVPASADSQSLVRFDTNDYSVPVQYAHRKLIVVATVEEVRLVYEDRLVARHRRCWEREQYLLRADPLPGPVGTQAGRVRLTPGRWKNWQLPECFALLRRRLEAADPRARHPVVHPGAAAVGEVLACRS